MEKPNTFSVHVAWDASEMLASLSLLRANFGNIPRKLVDDLLCLLDAPEKFFRLESNHLTTLGTNELRICLKPSDALRNLVATVHARNRDFGLVKKVCHL